MLFLNKKGSPMLCSINLPINVDCEVLRFFPFIFLLQSNIVNSTILVFSSYLFTFFTSQD